MQRVRSVAHSYEAQNYVERCKVSKRVPLVEILNNWRRCRVTNWWWHQFVKVFSYSRGAGVQSCSSSTGSNQQPLRRIVDCGFSVNCLVSLAYSILYRYTYSSQSHRLSLAQVRLSSAMCSQRDRHHPLLFWTWPLLWSDCNSMWTATHSERYATKKICALFSMDR